MIAVLSILLVVLFLLTALAWLPLDILVDTGQETFLQISVGHIFFIGVEAAGQGFGLELKILFFRKQIHLFPGKKRVQKVKEKKAGKQRASKFPKLYHIWKAFRLHYLEWQIDTGSFYYNAQLYPFTYLASHQPVIMSVNFLGQNLLRLKASTRIYRLAAIFLRTYT